MECKYAYMKQKTEYVLCAKEADPIPGDRTSLFHAVCPHQMHCPKVNCHKLSAGWVKCLKLAEAHQNAFERALGIGADTHTEAAPKPTRSRKKPKTEE